jgi:drug/metabolite transporter (DMT)-like permease
MSRLQAALAYLTMLAIWATVPLSLKWSLEGTTFWFAVTARIVTASLFMAVLIAAARVPLPRTRPAVSTYLISAGSFLGMLVMYWGARFIPSGWIAVMFGTMPLLTAIMSALWLGEKTLTGLRVAGLLVGIAGLAVMFATALAMSTESALGMAAVVVTVAIASASAVWIKRIDADLQGPAVSAGGLFTAMPVFVLVWFAADGEPPAQLELKTAGALIYIAVVGTGVVFSLFYYSMKYISLTRLALIGMLSPVIALTLGNVLNGEPLNTRIWTGAGLIVASLLLHEYIPHRLERARGLPETSDIKDTSLITRYD